MTWPKGSFWASWSKYDKGLIILTAISLALRILWLDKPSGSLIFDEFYYVNAGRVILGWPQTPGSNGKVPYPGAAPGIDPNREHLPLAKLIIAFSMWIQGDNAYGWRVPSVISGTASILLFYLLIKRLGKSPRRAFLATFLLSFENLIFVHSRIATLDIFMLTFMLLAFYLYLDGRELLSGVALALSTLCKISGVYGLLTLICYEYLQNLPQKGRLRRLKETFKERTARSQVLTLSYAAAFLSLLLILDMLWGAYNNPIDHLNYILSYTAKITTPTGIASYPWQWLINEVKISYIKVDAQIFEGGRFVGSKTLIHFVGAVNPAIIFLVLPAIAHSIDSWRRRGEDLSTFTLSWFASTYLPYYPLAIILHRTMYIFYFLQTVPSVCAAIAYMFSRDGTPKLVTLAYIISVLAGFAALFPFKEIP